MTWTAERRGPAVAGERLGRAAEAGFDAPPGWPELDHDRDRLPDMTRACQSGSRASSSGGMTRRACRRRRGCAQFGRRPRGWRCRGCRGGRFCAGGGPDGGGAVFAVLVAQLPGGVHHGGNLDALAGRVGEPGGQVDGAQVQLIEGEQQPRVEAAVGLGQAVAGGWRGERTR